METRIDGKFGRFGRRSAPVPPPIGVDIGVCERRSKEHFPSVRSALCDRSGRITSEQRGCSLCVITIKRASGGRIIRCHRENEQRKASESADQRKDGGRSFSLLNQLPTKSPGRPFITRGFANPIDRRAVFWSSGCAAAIETTKRQKRAAGRSFDDSAIGLKRSLSFRFEIHGLLLVSF